MIQLLANHSLDLEFPIPKAEQSRRALEDVLSPREENFDETVFDNVDGADDDRL